MTTLLILYFRIGPICVHALPGLYFCEISHKVLTHKNKIWGKSKMVDPPSGGAVADTALKSSAHVNGQVTVPRVHRQ